MIVTNNAIRNIVQYVKADDSRYEGYWRHLRSIDGHIVLINPVGNKQVDIVGDTYPIRQILVEAGYKWNKEDKCYTRASDDIWTRKYKGFNANIAFSSYPAHEHHNEYREMFLALGYDADSYLQHVSMSAMLAGVISYDEQKDFVIEGGKDTIRWSDRATELWTKITTGSSDRDVMKRNTNDIINETY